MNLFAPQDSRPIHFVGLGGAGMGGLALLALRRGVPVTGCDAGLSGTEDVVRAGARMLGGHDPGHVAGTRAVVYTSAVDPEHPEIVAAREAGIPVLRRAEALQASIEGGIVVAVAGTHGKTTTTVMVSDALTAAGCDPTGIAGGRVANWEGNAKFGESNLYVVEADEYDKSFLALNPSVAVINNLEKDHLECYGSVSELENAFVEFGSRAGRVLIGADDSGANRISDRFDVPVWKVGISERADVRITDIERDATVSRATVTVPGRPPVTLELQVPGLHNLRNAAMALASAAAVDADLEQAAAGLADFKGVGRRFELVGAARGITIIDDYAHHPTEIAVTIAAARQRYPDSRVVTAFQPHLFSRTREHGDAMGIALSTADVALVTDVYPAREKPLPGVDGRIVARAVEAAGGTSVWVEDLDQVPHRLDELCERGDVVITMGAGNITDASRRYLELLNG